NIIGAVAFRPFHLLDATVMAVAPPHDACVRPVFAQAFGHVLDDTPDLRALGRARRTKDGDNRGAARNMIDVHRRKAALIVMGVPERKLLATICRLENAPRKTEAARLCAALIDQFGTTVRPGKLEILDIDDTFCAAH